MAKISARGATELARWRRDSTVYVMRSDGVLLRKSHGSGYKIVGRPGTDRLGDVDRMLSRDGYERVRR